MSRKKPQPEDMEFEGAEGEEEEDEEGEGSGSESSSDDDELDSADDRLKVVPGESIDQVPSETLKPFAQEESSEDSSAESEESSELVMKVADLDAFHPRKLQSTGNSEKLKTLSSDVESEYDSESSSESEALTQKPAKDMMNESTIEAKEASPRVQKKVQNNELFGKIEAMEASPRGQKKVQNNELLGKKGMSEDDQGVKKGKDKALKQQQKDPPPSKTAKSEVSQQVQEENQPAKKGQGGAAKQVSKNDDQSQSLKNEKRTGLSAKKRKVEALQHDGETDSADSVPIAKKRNNTDAADNGKMGADRDKPGHVLCDTGKEIARKTLSDPTARANGVKDVVSKVENEPKQEKKSITNAIIHPSSIQKQKRLPHVWSTDEEITMASEVLNRVKAGLEVPSKKIDDFWLILSEILLERVGVEFSREQLSEKLRRMKQRYQGTVQRIKESQESGKQYKHKNNGEQRLFDIWSQIWGRAEVTSLEEHEETTVNDVKKEPSKPMVLVASPVRESKNGGDHKGINVPKMKPSSKAKASKEVVMVITREALEVDQIAAEAMELDKEGSARECHGRDGVSSPADYSGFLSKDVHKWLQEKIHATLHELQEWSKHSMEEWMTKALALIKNTGKTLGDQARCMNGMGTAGGALPVRICNSMESPFVHGEPAFQQQWYELHLQELNVYAQRLELMRKECELKQEQLKLQLQLEREK